MAKKTWNAIVSAIADPFLRKTAEKFTASIPPDSWLRSEIAERILAGLKGLAESYNGSGLSGILVEKITDFFDFMSGPLFKKEKEGSATAVAQNWIQKFWADAQKSLAETPAEKLEEVRQRLKEDFRIRKEIFRVVLEAEKEFQPQKIQPKTINWAELDARAAEWLERNRPSWIKRRPKGGSR